MATYDDARAALLTGLVSGPARIKPEAVAAFVASLTDALRAEEAAADIGQLVVSDIIDALTSTSATKPLSANQGHALKALIDGLTLAGIADTASYVRMTATERSTLASMAAIAGHFKGAYSTLAACVAANAAPETGSWAILTQGSGSSATIAVWDSDNSPAAWVDTGFAAPTTLAWSAITSVPAWLTTLIGYGSASALKSALAIVWSDIGSRPTTVSAFTNDSGYVAGSCYESGEIALATTGPQAKSAAHGLPAVPKKLRAVLRCKTAELGYTAGIDEVDVTTGGLYNYTYFNTAADGTSLTWTNGAANIYLNNKSTGVSAAITPANWKLVLRAWSY